MRYRENVVSAALQVSRRHSTKAAEWAYWPMADDVYQWPEFELLINDPSDKDLDTLIALDTFRELAIQGRIQKWKDEQVKHLLSLLPTDKAHSTEDLRLANCIFESRSRNPTKNQTTIEVFTSFEEVSRGDTLQEHRRSLSFSQRGNGAVKSLCELVKLNSSTLLTKEVDPKLRFICVHCERSKKRRTGLALSWNEAVSMVISSWTLLTYYFFVSR